MRWTTAAIAALGAALAAVTLLPPAAAQTGTGWYLMSDGEAGDAKYIREVLIAAGKIKELPRYPTATWVVYDVNDREITIVDPARRVYARATPAEHCRSLADAGDALQAALGRLPSDAAGPGATVPSAGTTPPEVSIRERTPRTRLQDFEEVLYEIRADGRWFERVWLTTDERLLNALGGLDGLAAYVDMRHEFETCSRRLLRSAADPAADAARIAVESSPAYLEVMRKGWPLSMAWNEADGQVTEAVNIAAEWRVPASDLEPPGTYRRLSLAQYFDLRER